MLKVKSLLLPGISLFLLSMLPIAQVGRAESAPSSKPIGEPLCYQTTTNGTVLDLSKLCAENNQHKLTPEAKLANLSKAAIEAENQALISGNSKQGANLFSHGIRYTDFQTELKINKTKIQGNKASVDATEHTTMNLDNSGDPSAPKTTEYYQDRRLTFNLENDHWKLKENQIVNAPVTAPEPGVPLIDKSTIPTSTNNSQSKNSNYQKNNLIAQAGEKLNKLLSFKQPINYFQVLDNSKKFNLDTQLIAAASLNRQAIIDYAYKYWSNYNSSYRTFSDNDCTNFVSQSLFAGGWTQISGAYDSISAWYYGNLNQSYTWTSAGHLYAFTKNGRASLANNISELQPGDFLQADWNKDGWMDHAMIVTSKDSKGNIYLTAHTNNRKDLPFWQMPSNANYYGWKLNSQSTSPNATCSASPNEANCNNQDPVKQGCNDGYTVSTASFAQGKVELRYSPTCKSNWAKVTNFTGNGYTFAQIMREDGKSYSYDSYSSTVYTNMVYSPVLKAKASGKACGSSCSSASTGWY